MLKYIARLFPQRTESWGDFIDLVRDENSKSITARYTIRSHASGGLAALIGLESGISTGYSTYNIFSLEYENRRMLFEELSKVFSNRSLDPDVERQKNIDALVQFDTRVKQIVDQTQRTDITIFFLGREYGLSDYNLMMAEQLKEEK